MALLFTVSVESELVVPDHVIAVFSQRLPNTIRNDPTSEYFYPIRPL
jgi:hypothetical protein